MLDRGHEVEIVWSRPRSDAKFFRELDGLVQRGATATEINVPRKPHPSDKRAIGTVVESIAKNKPDIVHGHSSKAGAIARLASRSTRVPSIYTPHGFVTMDVRLPGWKRAVFTRLENWLDQFASRTIAVSRFEASHAESLGLDATKLKVIHNGVPDRRGQVPTEPRIGFVGRLSPEKNPMRFLQAIVRLRAGGMGTPVTMIGDGPLRADCEEFIKSNSISNIELLGNVDALEHFPRFSVLAITSDNEAFPYVALEAQSFGIPVVGTEIGALKEIISNPLDGQLCALDERSIVLGLARVLNDPSYGELCRTKPHRFGIDEMVEKTIAVYRECAG